MSTKLSKYDKFLNEEVGLRNIKEFAKLHKTCEIYFHKDLDGVTSALAMKEFLKNFYQIETVDCHIIQYGGLEYAIEHHKPENLSVLVDFAHGKPMFHIQSDHHDKQVGADDTQSTYFKPARSNVEIISGEISYSDIFTPQDIELIKTVDSANFLQHNINIEDVQNSIFKFERTESAQKNRFIMGFVVNRLLLAYKNKRISCKSLDGKRNHVNRNILECLVLDSSPSLYSMFNNIKHYINFAKTSDRAGKLASPEEVRVNLENYIAKMKDYKFIEDPTTGESQPYDPTNKKHQYLSTQGAKIGKGVHFDEEYKIISQYGGGPLFAAGSYDRYVPFKNFPESEFLCIVWPMGLIQVSCNPFKEKKLKNINLGEIAKEVLAKHQPMLSKFYIPLESIKKEFETSQDWKAMQKAIGDQYQGVGFKWSDLSAFYLDCIFKKDDGKVKNILDELATIDFETADEKNIVVKITHKSQTFSFDIINVEKIKSFLTTINSDGNTNIFADYLSNNEKQTELSENILEIAKRKMKKILTDLNLVSSEKDNIKVFRSLSNKKLIDAMNTNYTDLSDDQIKLLSELKIPVWELIIRNSGGHPSITNVSGLNFLKYNKNVLNICYKTEKYVDVLKMLAREFINNLKEKIDAVNSGQQVSYDTKGIELLGQDTNENYTYHLVDKSGKYSQVPKEDFIKAGSAKGMKTDRKSLMTIDTQNKRVIAKFEKFNPKS